MNVLINIGRYLRTLRHLKLIQIINRIKRKVWTPRVDLSYPPDLSFISREFHYIKKKKSIVRRSLFNFLNIDGHLNFPEGWNDTNYSKLWLYNLHYCEGLLNDETLKSIKQYHIKHWILQNPVGTGNGWEPYPNSLRIVNWIKWALSGNELSPEAIQSLAIQVRFLERTLEYHLLGNHLFVNLKSLVFAGCFFTGREAEGWLKKGIKGLIKEVPEQFLADGGHFELSPTYHAILTEDLIDIINILQISGRSAPVDWIKTIEKALGWLQVMTRPDGLPPLFNDAAYGISPTLEQLIEYSCKLGIAPHPMEKAGVLLLPESGYFRHDEAKYSIIGDVGQIGPSYQPAHAHCDMMNFELFSEDKPIIVDTGTSTYEVGPVRYSERSTAAHNTVQLKTYEQSEIWGGFRVGKRARIVKRVVGENFIEAGHDGYKKEGGIHTRKFTFYKDAVHVKDFIKGSGEEAICRIHLSPGIQPKLNGQEIKADHVTLRFEDANSIEIKNYEYAPEFNKRVPAKVIEIVFSNSLTTYIKL